MRLIDADALREFLVRAGRFLKIQDDKRTAAHAIGKIIEHIDNMPTIDAVPVVHGHWKSCRFSDGGLYQEQCSVCGGWSHDIGNYCPDCGAKIDEVSADAT